MSRCSARPQRLYGRRLRNQRQVRGRSGFACKPASAHGQTPPPQNPLGPLEVECCPGVVLRVVAIVVVLGALWKNRSRRVSDARLMFGIRPRGTELWLEWHRISMYEARAWLWKLEHLCPCGKVWNEWLCRDRDTMISKLNTFVTELGAWAPRLETQQDWPSSWKVGGRARTIVGPFMGSEKNRTRWHAAWLSK